ncbi:MAG: 2-succinyl-5-enolpyruvyl-6-hydroxy-3-cyclohexene-carboxylate synthase, partial [Actinomycetota bacterium]|nr:2-succinyl-5-enolpyruvyl-6-hydroxy-3-cyclohexene-carboxylate synthase [Actinomycetota bacterium]
MRASTPAQALSRVMVDELIRHGVKHACLAPGSRSAPLALAFAESEIELHVGLDERSVSFLAVGIAKTSHEPVAVLCTSGTAAANLHPAIVEAHHSRTPLIAFTADRPPELRDTGASQTIDQIKMFGDAVRWFAEVGVPETQPTSNAYWRSVVSHAVAMATGSPPGAVHLNVAFRDPLVPTDDEAFPYELDGRADGGAWAEVVTGQPDLSGDELRRVTDELTQAKSGVVVAGAGTFAGAGPRRVAAELGWPLLADPFSGARSGDAISTYDALLSHEPFRKKRAPDVVLRFGAGILSKPLASLISHAPSQFLVDRDGWFLDPGRSTTRVITADVDVFADRLIEALADVNRNDSHHEHLEAWSQADAAARKPIDGLLDEDDSPSEPRVARDVAAAIPDGGTLVVASSMPLRDVEAFMAPREGLRLIANRGANGIDGFVSTALGVALASGGPTVALCGDLSMLHDQNGLLLLR